MGNSTTGKIVSLISVIVTTYNWEAALAQCLNSLLAQHDRNFEILIADDGSSPATRQLIQNYPQTDIAIHHVYQADEGFRAAAIRNKAVAQSQGDYLIFMDGDCIAFPDFIQKHRELAQPSYFVAGNRILLSESFTQEVLTKKLDLTQQPFSYFIKLRLTAKINRLLPLLKLPLVSWRLKYPKKWQQAMTCNLAVNKQDFIDINGFDEVFAGWGYEDSDLVIRLIHHHIYRKEGRFAVPVLHCWHQQNDRSQHDANYQRLMQRIEFYSSPTK